MAVGGTASFMLAAQSLFISQSTLSGPLKELTQMLGLHLVDRSARRVTCATSAPSCARGSTA